MFKFEIVYDTRFLAAANGALEGRRPNTALDKRLSALEAFTTGRARARYNPKLYHEYVTHICEKRNDIIYIFFTMLDKAGCKVGRNTLERQVWARIKHAWQSHDQHLLAAAIDGVKPHIVTNEKKLGEKAADVKRLTSITVVVIE